MIIIKKIKRKLILSVIILILILLTISGYTLAKYVSNHAWNNYLESKGFYFNSDELNVVTTKNVNKNWDGNSIHFVLNNSKGKTYITDYDIEYNVKCTIKGNDNLSCNLMGNNSNIYNGVLNNVRVCKNDKTILNSYTEKTCIDQNYQWVSSESNKDIFFDIASSGEDIRDVTVNIEVTSIKPYKKILKGEYILHKSNISDGIIINYNDYYNYGNLIITNVTNNDKNVFIEFNSNNLKIDNVHNELDNYNVDSNGIINNAIVNVSNNSNKVIKFYKSNKDNYSISDFNVSINE